MNIIIKCFDCGRHIGSFVRLKTGKKDIEIEIHACYHKDIYDHIKELQTENKRLKKEIGDLRAAAVRKVLMKGGSFTGKR